MSKKITFVVRAKNEERWIGHCLQSIADRVEDPRIIVVDNESTDDTLKIAKLFNPRIITVTQREYTPGFALNEAMDHVQTEIACILSAHCVLDQIDLESVRIEIEGFERPGVYGRQIPLYRGVRMDVRGTWDEFKIERTEEDEIFFHNAFSFIDKRAWEQLPFDQFVTGKEDKLWAQKFAELYEREVEYTPIQTCFHHWTPGCATWRGLG